MNTIFFNYRIYNIDNGNKKVYLKFNIDSLNEDGSYVPNNWDDITNVVIFYYPNYRIIIQDENQLDWEELIHDNGEYKSLVFYLEGNYN